MTHYEVLGVDEGAPPTEIRRAYVRLARRHHPDFFVAADGSARAEAERAMRVINEAWSVLGDGRRRHRYDQTLGRGGGLATDPGEGRRFEPFDDGEDDIDPLDLPDQPYRRGDADSSRLGRAATLAPVVAFAASIGLGALGMVVGSAGLIALAVACFVAACLGFVVTPLLALSRASRND